MNKVLIYVEGKITPNLGGRGLINYDHFLCELEKAISCILCYSTHTTQKFHYVIKLRHEQLRQHKFLLPGFTRFYPVDKHL